MKERSVKKSTNEYIRVDRNPDIEELARHLVMSLQEAEIVDLSDYDSQNNTLCITYYTLDLDTNVTRRSTGVAARSVEGNEND